MKCPKCEDAPLESRTVDGVEVDHCRGCGGYWFDRAELGTLLDADERRVEELLGGEDQRDLDHKPGACPRDAQGLLRVVSLRNRDVILDSCPVCQGIWLDGGEFERIKHAQPGIKLGEIV